MACAQNYWGFLLPEQHNEAGRAGCRDIPHGILSSCFLVPIKVRRMERIAQCLVVVLIYLAVKAGLVGKKRYQ